MTWALLSGGRVVATGSWDAVLARGVEVGCVAEERYEARRTGDEVVRRRLLAGASMVPAAWVERDRRRAA